MASFLRRGFEFSSQGQPMRFAGYSQPEDLQDALQETFLLAFGQGARQGYNGLTPFGSYLRGIAKNVVLGRFRKNLSMLSRFRSLDPDGLAPAEAIGQSLPPEAAIQKSRMQRIVQEFVDTLDEEQKRIIQYHFLENLSQRATAEQLSLNRNRVRKQIKTIRKRLWRRLRREGVERLPSIAALEVEQ
ncbi:MAG: sigma-70 family RNA polymerase sigma factor [Deltaproteobacteria bacterium]|nr:sigma-70 family RNA polymerase sigma factor [Deltaproteobacteria bacterium]